MKGTPGTKRQFDQVISLLSSTADQFGEYNLLHSKRVAVIATALSEYILPEKKDIVFYASLLHDIGAVIFGEHPMMFPYIEEQKRIPCIYDHSIVGSGLMDNLDFPNEAKDFIHDHHEWYDGSGYPDMKRNGDISLGGQLIRVADAIDQLRRAYGKMEPMEIYNYLRIHKGKEYNPKLWDVILDTKNKDGGEFFVKISDDNWVKQIFMDVLKSADPHWVKTLDTMDKFLENILEIFADTIDAKSKYTATNHSRRIAVFCERIANTMELKQSETNKVKYAAYIHDIGKTYIPNDILEKMGYLSEREKGIMKRHAVMAMEVLDSVEILRDLVPFVGFHQERYDGKGYPDGLEGENIPIGARILNVADSVDAMLSRRPYREALGIENTIVQLQRCSGTQFDPFVATVAIGLLSEKEIVKEIWG